MNLTKMTGINDLPVELYELIFSGNLSINDLFNCRLVNKQFKFATYECVQQLVVGDLDEYTNDYWFHNNELINDNHVISLKCFKEIRSRSIFNLDKYLKYLIININKDNLNEFKNELNEELSILNNLINLQCLEINFIDNYDFKFDINLKNLKYLRLNVNRPICELNTPKLEKIAIYDMYQIKFKNNLESIGHLIIYDYKEELKQFKNLEIIEFKIASNLDENLLSFFNNLKQLKIEILLRLTNSLKDCLIKILDKSKELNRDIDIYLNDVKIISEDKIKEYKLFDGNILRFQLNNYELLDLTIPSITHLDYSELNNYYDNLRNDLPASFFNRYQNISDVFVSDYGNNKPIDSDDLNWFLNNLKYLKKLEIRGVLLDQEFFDNIFLPNTIKVLNIRDYSNDSALFLNINFNFIFKLTKLIDFRVSGCKIDLFDLALKSFENLNYLRTFTFHYKRKLIKIKKENRSTFRFDDSTDNSKIELDYEQLTRKCSEFRSE